MPNATAIAMVTLSDTVGKIPKAVNRYTSDTGGKILKVEYRNDPILSPRNARSPIAVWA